MWRLRRLARTWSGCLDHLATSRAPGCPASLMATTGRHRDDRKTSHMHAARTLQHSCVSWHCTFKVRAATSEAQASALVPRDLCSRRGFAFMDFASKQEAQAALEATTGTHLYGRRLVVEWADQVLASSSALRTEVSSMLYIVNL
jgi:RNA recognition motif. (a.k.a. RRM, RBD, or RNP domain)